MKTSKYSDTITLGELIAQLERFPTDAKVRFDFGLMGPTNLASYRGFYEELALGYTEDGSYPDVAALLRQLRSAVGETFHGYKGGAYRMGLDTGVWVSNQGEAGDTIILSVQMESETMALICTRSDAEVPA